MEEQNELLRSAYQIAQREGKNTNWEAFSNNLEKELLKQAGCIGMEDKSIDQRQQITLRATCTAKTYKISKK
jgi:hypothetical protein